MKVQINEKSNLDVLRGFDLGGLGSAKPDYKEVEVSILSEITQISALMNRIQEDYNNMIVTRGGKSMWAKGELEKYAKHLIAARVAYVTSDKDGTSVYNRVKHNVYLPNLLSILIATIGECYFEQYGLILKPKYDFKLDVSIILETSRKLEIMMKSFGISMANGLPSDKSGDAKVLSFNYIANQAKEFEKLVAPDSNRSEVEAVLAFILSVNLAENTLTQRVTYINAGMDDFIVRSLANLETRMK